MRAFAAARALVLASLLASPAAAMPGDSWPWSAEDLRDACGDGYAYYAYGSCAGYLSAVRDIVIEQPFDAPMACVPEGATMFWMLEDLSQAVFSLPPIEGESGVALAIRAWAAVHPCE